MRYEGQIYRIFSEADSYLLQCTIGCPHNGRTFCGIYQDRRFRIRSSDVILEDIRMARHHNGDVEKVFLCDGDAVCMADLARLRAAGLTKAYLGVESVNAVLTSRDIGALRPDAMRGL